MKSCFFFTPFFLNALDAPEKDYVVHGDTQVPVLKLYVTANGVKSFFIRKRVNGKDERFILGRYPEMSIEEARDLAIETYNKLNSIKTKKIVKRKDAKFLSVVKLYLTKQVKREQYGKKVLEHNINRFWEALFNYNISEISVEHISTMHLYIEKHHGASMANRMLEIMRGVFRFAIRNNYIDKNPAMNVAKFITSRRHKLLTVSECKDLVAAIKQEKNSVIQSALLMLFFTGQQKMSVLSMKWDQIDFNRNLWCSKGEEIALSDSALMLLERINQKSVWVFPNRISKSGHIMDLKRPWHRVVERSGRFNTQIDDIHKTLKYYVEDLRQKNKDELKTFDFEHKLLNKVLQILRIY